MKTLVKTLLLLLPVILFTNCNPSGTAYYMFKWIGNKKLKTPTTIHIDYEFSAKKIRQQDGYTLCAQKTPVDFIYINDYSSKEYSSYTRRSLRSEFEEEEMITIVQSEEADFILKVQGLILTEDIEVIPRQSSMYELSHCDAELLATLYDRNGNKIETKEFVAYENEALRERINDEGEVEYKERTFNFNFKTLIKRTADETKEWTETHLARRLND